MQSIIRVLNTKFAQEVLQHRFLLRVIYYIIPGTCTQHNLVNVLHVSFFYTISTNSKSLAPTRSKSIYPTLEGSKEVKIRGGNIWTVWFGEEQSV